LFVTFKAPEPLRAKRNDEAARRFEASLSAMRRSALAAAKALLEVDRCGHFVYEGCASVGEFGERHGASAGEARRLVALAMAAEICPPLEERVLTGRIPLESAARLYAALSRARPGDDWLGWAETESTRSLRRRVDQRVEETRLGEAPAVALTVFLSLAGRDGLARARAIASRKADRTLTEGETIEATVDHYLTSFDPMRAKAGSRRLPHTSTVGGRYVPAEVRRQLMARGDDRCAIPFCDHDIFLENAHVVSHARGGHRDADNLLRLCSKHHRMLDEGKLRQVGPAGDPKFADARGRGLSRRAPPSSTAEPPRAPTAGEAAEPILLRPETRGAAPT